jgi:opacity protein-like surface antigen
MLKRFSLTLLAATAIGGIATQGALAADILRKAPPPAPLPAPVQDWSGVYVGVEGGYGWGHQSVNSTVPFLLTPADTDCHTLNDSFPACASPSDGLGGLHGLDANFAELSPIDITASGHNQSGGVIGGFFGVQKQWGSWVLGVEGSVDYAHISSSQATNLSSTVIHTNPPDDGPLNEGTFTRATNSVNFDSTIDEIAAVNAKIGYAWSPNWMIYGTAGMAFAHEKNNIGISQSLFHLDCETTDATAGILACDARTGAINHPADDTADGLVRFASASFAGSGGTTLFGWTAGAGIDYKVQIDPGSAWVFGIDYKHYGFGNHTFTMAGNNGGSFSFNSSQDIDVIKGRISYLFSIH